MQATRAATAVCRNWEALQGHHCTRQSSLVDVVPLGRAAAPDASGGVGNAMSESGTLGAMGCESSLSRCFSVAIVSSLITWQQDEKTMHESTKHRKKEAEKRERRLGRDARH